MKVQTDASGYAIGSVLLQNDGAGWRPVAFHSRKLLGAETQYDTREQELLSIHEALVQWRAYLEGIKFTVETDHESLKWLQDQRILNRRQARWVMNFQTYDFSIGYTPGNTHVVADVLSRRPDLSPRCDRCRLRLDAVAVSLTQPIDTQILKEQRNDPDCQYWIDALTNPKNLDKGDQYFLRKLTCNDIDGLRYHGRLFVPDFENLRLRLLTEYHESKPAGHPGGTRMYASLGKGYYWPNMEKDVKQFATSCDECQRTKHTHTASSGFLHPLDIPKA